MSIMRDDGAASTSTTAQFQSQQRRPVLKLRRYGRNDFETFDEEAARGSILSVGSAAIGEVGIDCKYHWRKAQWGVLGNEKRPAGIIYMDITFRQPHGYWLERAHVYVTLSQDASTYALSSPSRDRETRYRPLSSDYTVQITDNYGPQYLVGVKTMITRTKEDMLIPIVGVMGFEFGGIGRKIGSSMQHVSQWVFKGTLCKPQGRNGLQTLEWELSENKLNPGQTHNQTYHTAFAFEHSKRPVFMRVEVEGKLRGRRRKIKHALVRFSSGLKGEDKSTLIKIDLEHTEFRKSLDQTARDLDMTMLNKNLNKVPVELPDQMPASFIPEPITQNSPGGAQITQRQQSPSAEEPATREGQDAEERVKPQEHERRFLEDRSQKLILESLQRQLQNRANRGASSHNPTAEARDRGSGTTDEEGATVVGSEPPPIEPATKSPEMKVDETLLEILKIPAVLMLFRLIANVLQRFSKTQQTTSKAATRDGRQFQGIGAEQAKRRRLVQG
ncbi:hypothetical protein VTH06DRAFT_6236 [Thermothelomyces fergusii]